jgi:antitoxin (DNA-binding transcriptional repressor) of toxin-antitoxin stability system
MKIGTKELKNRLSHYLRPVQQGEAVQVTVRGAVVAELRVVREVERSDDACLHALEQQGLLTIGKKRLGAFVPLVPRGKKHLSAMVIEDREDLGRGGWTFRGRSWSIRAV